MDKLFVAVFAGLFSNNPLDSSPNGKGDTTRLLKFGIFLFIVLILILLFTGSETVKLVCRKKMGVEEISFLRVILSVMVFVGFGFTALEPSDIKFHSPYYYVGTTSAYMTALFFFSLATFNFVFGISSKIRKSGSNVPDYYAGDSLFFGFLQEKVGRGILRNVVEPAVFLLLGAVCGYLGHELIGIALGTCSISYWIVLMIESALGVENTRIKADEMYFANNVRTISNNRESTEGFIVR